jgi:hypothetical protein
MSNEMICLQDIEVHVKGERVDADDRVERSVQCVKIE